MQVESSDTHSLQLLSDAELFDDCAVTLNIHLHQVVQKVSSVTDHLEKAATAVEVLVVVLEVCVEVVDAVCEKRDLYLRRACVALTSLVLFNNCLLYVFLHDVFHLSFNLRKLSERWVKCF